MIEDRYTFCAGGSCPLKKECLRYAPKLNVKKQDHFEVPPFRITDGNVKCGFFEPSADNKVMDEVKRILNAEAQKNKGDL